MFCLLALGMRRLCLHLLTIFHCVLYFPFLLLGRTLCETLIKTPWIKENNELWMPLDHGLELTGANLENQQLRLRSQDQVACQPQII